MKTATPRSAADATGETRLRVTGVVDRVDDFAYPVITVIAVVIVFAGQLAEDFVDSPPLQMMPPVLLFQRWVVVALVLYCLVMWALLRRTVGQSLPQVRHVVKVDRDTFDDHVARMAAPPVVVELAILLGVVVLDVVLFVGMNSDLLFDDPVTRQAKKLPTDPIVASIILAGYTVIGWAFLRLIIYGARLARELGRLARRPLQINVFDTSDLGPFGNIALAVALAPAGVLVILLIGLGAPTTPVGWSVVAETTLVIVLVMLLPLRGIHQQMSAAKDVALTALNARIGELYAKFSVPLQGDATEVGRLSAATGALVPLRRTVQEMTTWPFRNTVALGRAVLIASAPLIYTTLSELIRVFIIGPISP